MNLTPIPNPETYTELTATSCNEMVDSVLSFSYNPHVDRVRLFIGTRGPEPELTFTLRDRASVPTMVAHLWSLYPRTDAASVNKWVINIEPGEYRSSDCDDPTCIHHHGPDSSVTDIDHLLKDLLRAGPEQLDSKLAQLLNSGDPKQQALATLLGVLTGKAEVLAIEHGGNIPGKKKPMGFDTALPTDPSKKKEWLN